MACILRCLCPDPSSDFHDDEAILNDAPGDDELAAPPPRRGRQARQQAPNPADPAFSPRAANVDRTPDAPATTLSSSSSPSSPSPSSPSSSSSSSSSSSPSSSSSSSSTKTPTKAGDDRANLSERIDQVIGLSTEIEELAEKAKQLDGFGRAEPSAELVELGKQALRLLIKLLRVLPSSQLRCLVISSLLAREVALLGQDEPGPYFNRPALRSAAESLQSSAKASFFMQLAMCLPARDKLAKTLCDLPAAVLGDQLLRDQTRVLIDLESDTAASVRNEKGRAVRKYTPPTIDLADTVVDNLHQLLVNDQVLVLLAALQPGGQLTPESLQRLRWRAFVSLMSQIAPGDRQRLFVQQLILSKVLPYDPVTREELIDYIMSVPAPVSSSSS